ncbi:SusF/SusE family outer membrane protein [Pontibacter korlensis]|uniref:SusF/SusE family outer membrane protein n=1 Tax=Pontibacter korlensis TaxID=400092 RepID=UPI000697556A|nr:SusF/SusE family outer membrane protein [Pontibacter korlensis]
MERVNILYKLLALLSLSGVMLMFSSCDEVGHELDELVVSLDAQTPDTVYFGESFEVKLLANQMKEVQISLSHKDNPSESVYSETIVNENNSFAFSTEIEVPEDGSWNGDYILKAVATGNGAQTEKSRPIHFKPSPVQNYFLVGGSSVAGWEPANGIQLKRYTKEEDGIITEWYDVFGYFTVDGHGLKVLPTTTGWDGGYGAKKGAPGTLDNTGDADNITVPEDGFYRLRINPKAGTYELVKSNWGIIGDATPGGWDNDTDMTLVSASKGKYEWTATINLQAGKEFKFRENDKWDINLGLDGAGPQLKYDGGNVRVDADGQYVVKLNLSPAGYTYTISR